MAVPETVQRSRPARSRPRAWLSRTLAAVCIGLAPVALVVHWTSDTVLDTDNYVRAIHDLPTQPTVSTAIAEIVVEHAMALSPLPQAVLKGARPTLLTAVRSAVESEPFQQVWSTANRTAQMLVLAALEGGAAHVTPSPTEAVVLDVGAVLDVVGQTLPTGPQQVLDGLALAATRQPLTVRIPLDPGVFVTAQHGVRIIRIADIAVPWCLLAAGGAGIWLAPRRRRTLAILTAGISVTCCALAIVVKAALGSPAAGADAAVRTIGTAFGRSLTAPVVHDALSVGAVAGIAAAATIGVRWGRRSATAAGHDDPDRRRLPRRDG